MSNTKFNLNYFGREIKINLPTTAKSRIYKYVCMVYIIEINIKRRKMSYINFNLSYFGEEIKFGKNYHPTTLQLSPRKYKYICLAYICKYKHQKKKNGMYKFQSQLFW